MVVASGKFNVDMTFVVVVLPVVDASCLKDHSIRMGMYTYTRNAFAFFCILANGRLLGNAELGFVRLTLAQG